MLCYCGDNIHRFFANHVVGYTYCAGKSTNFLLICQILSHEMWLALPNTAVDYQLSIVCQTHFLLSLPSLLAPKPGAESAGSDTCFVVRQLSAFSRPVCFSSVAFGEKLFKIHFQINQNHFGASNVVMSFFSILDSILFNFCPQGALHSRSKQLSVGPPHTSGRPPQSAGRPPQSAGRPPQTSVGPPQSAGRPP